MASENNGESDYVGQSYRRPGDIQFLNGDAEYTHDIMDENMLHVSFVRSPHAHADIVDIDVSNAEAMDGVHAILTGKEIEERSGPIPSHPVTLPPDEHALAIDRVWYVGHPVAMVAAESKYLAQDAADQINVEYEKRPFVLDPREALEEDAPVVHPEFDGHESPTYSWQNKIEGNRLYSHKVDVGDINEGFDEADHIIEGEFTAGHSFSGLPMETPAVVAKWDASNGKLEFHDSTQIPQVVKSYLSMTLDIDASKVRVFKPELGGGFGNKCNFYNYEVAMALVAMELPGQYVKLVMDRSEHLVATRGTYRYDIQGKLGVKEDGTITALEMDVVHDEGATAFWGVPVHELALSGIAELPYKIPNVKLDGKVVYTNTPPKGPIRGTGGRQLTFAKERLVDKAANELGMDKLEFRRRNFITESECPYDSPTGARLPHCQLGNMVDELEEAYEEFRREAENDPNKGVGVATWTEWSACRILPADYGSAIVKMEEDGSVRVAASSADMGQGTRTTLAQVCADQLGVHPDRVDVIEGDTDATPSGLGAWGSRCMVIDGTAVHRATKEVRDRILKIAAHNLETSVEDLVLEDGEVHVRGSRDISMSVEDIATVAHYNKNALPDDVNIGALVGSGSYDSADAELENPANLPDEKGRQNTSGAYTEVVHLALVETDPETGQTEVVKYVAADDVGKAVNPDIVHGQVTGGVFQGISSTLGEELVYDENGQVLTDNLSSYAIRSAPAVPPIETRIFENSPAPDTPEGWKGVGESGMFGSPAALGNAVSNAIDADIDDLPITPDRVFEFS